MLVAIAAIAMLVLPMAWESSCRNHRLVSVSRTNGARVSYYARISLIIAWNNISVSARPAPQFLPYSRNKWTKNNVGAALAAPTR
jgi:hypothetical protein